MSKKIFLSRNTKYEKSDLQKYNEYMENEEECNNDPTLESLTVFVETQNMVDSINNSEVINASSEDSSFEFITDKKVYLMIN